MDVGETCEAGTDVSDAKECENIARNLGFTLRGDIKIGSYPYQHGCSFYSYCNGETFLRFNQRLDGALLSSNKYICNKKNMGKMKVLQFLTFIIMNK